MDRDSKGRTLAKTIVYRAVAIATLAAITYYLTGDPGKATTITILFNLGATGAYYALERLWESVEWGRSPIEKMHLRTDGWALRHRGLSDSSKDITPTAEPSLPDDVEAD